MRRIDPRPYPLDLDQRIAVGRATDTLRYLREQGTRQSHGIGPGTPLSPGMLRDIRTAERAIARVLAADTRNRGTGLRYTLED